MGRGRREGGSLVKGVAALTVATLLGVGMPSAGGTGRVALGPVWQRHFGGRIAAGPVVAGDLVLVVNTTPVGGDPTLRALDRASGRTRWARVLPALPAAAPLIAGGMALVLLGAGELVGIELRDGTLRWRKPTGPPFDVPPLVSPLVAGGLVFIPSNDGGVRALDVATGALRWQRMLDARAWAAPALVGDTLYVPTGLLELGGRGALYALDSRTGEQRWRASIDSVVSSVPAAADSLVAITTGGYDATPGGSVVAIDRRSGTVGWQATPGGRLSDAVVVAQRVVVASSTGALEARDPAGQLRWRVDIGASRAPAVVSVGGMVVAAGAELVAVDPGTGAVRWRAPVPEAQFRARPTEGLVIAVTGTGDLTLVEAYRGRVLARRSLLDDLTGVAVLNRRVYEADDWGTINAAVLRPASQVHAASLSVCRAVDPPRFAGNQDLPHLGQTTEPRVRAVLSADAGRIRARFGGVRSVRVEPRGGAVAAGANQQDVTDDFWIVVELRSSHDCPDHRQSWNGVPLRFVADTPP
jgi:outer membrane protein assembly factor BamB